MNKSLLDKTYKKLLKEIQPENLIYQQCFLNDNILTIQDDSIDLSKFKNIYLLGSGKAVIPMSNSIQKILKDKITQTLIIGAYENNLQQIDTQYIKSTHPIPSQQSITAAKTLKDMLQNFNEDDLFIYVLSGGNSALVELPQSNITLDEFQKTTSLMIKGAMPIGAINCVRKHISQVKGGKLAQYTKAKGIVLVLSDVIGDDLHTIGSAPLYCDTSTFEQAVEYLQSYNLFDQIPKNVQTFLKDGCKNLYQETPKKPNKNIKHYILGSNTIVLQKAKEILEKFGIAATISNKTIEGDVNKVAQELVDFANAYQGEKHCFIFGGEATVLVHGDGKGGRNQHLAMCVLALLDGSTDITFLSASTDGIDGNSNAAGVLIDMHSLVNKNSSNINWKHYLETFNSNDFFNKTDELLISGPTHNNLLDIVMIIIEPKLKQGTIDG